MKQPVWRMTVVVLVLLVGCGGLLSYARSVQRLGQPGVRVESVPMFCRPADQASTNLFLANSNSVILPETVAGYRSIALPLSWEVYDLLPKDTVFGQRIYQAPDGFQILNNVVLMGADRSSIHQPQFCLPAQGYTMLNTETDVLRIAKPYAYDLPVVKITAERSFTSKEGAKTTMRAIYVYWFVTDEQITADHVERMWWMARDLILTGVLRRWAYVAYMGVCPVGQEDATYARMKQFITTAVPEYQRVAGPARAEVKP